MEDSCIVKSRTRRMEKLFQIAQGKIFNEQVSNIKTRVHFCNFFYYYDMNYSNKINTKNKRFKRFSYLEKKISTLFYNENGVSLKEILRK